MAERLIVVDSDEIAKGDLVTFAGPNEVALLSRGSNGQVLTTDSDAPTGMKWATPESGGGAVTSVNGNVGDVVLDADDVGARPDDWTPGVADLDVTGTADSTTFLRGDGSWQPVPGGGGGAVDSVNGQTGVVTLTAEDVGARADDWTPAAADISDATSVGQDVMTAVDAAAARSAIGAGTASTKTDVGLGNVENVAQLPASALDTDPDLTADSDNRVPSQKAVRAFVASQGGGGGGPIESTDITDSTEVGRGVLTAADQATARTAIGAGTASTKADVGLGNVTNVAQLAESALDTDPDLTADSDAKVPSQKAVKSYVASHAVTPADLDARIGGGLVLTGYGPTPPDPSGLPDGHVWFLTEE